MHVVIGQKARIGKPMKRRAALIFDMKAAIDPAGDDVSQAFGIDYPWIGVGMSSKCTASRSYTVGNHLEQLRPPFGHYGCFIDVFNYRFLFHKLPPGYDVATISIPSGRRKREPAKKMGSIKPAYYS